GPGGPDRQSRHARDVERLFHRGLEHVIAALGRAARFPAGNQRSITSLYCRGGGIRALRPRRQCCGNNQKSQGKALYNAINHQMPRRNSVSLTPENARSSEYAASSWQNFEESQAPISGFPVQQEQRQARKLRRARGMWAQGIDGGAGALLGFGAGAVDPQQGHQGG